MFSRPELHRGLAAVVRALVTRGGRLETPAAHGKVLLAAQARRHGQPKHAVEPPRRAAGGPARPDDPVKGHRRAPESNKARRRGDAAQIISHAPLRHGHSREKLGALRRMSRLGPPGRLRVPRYFGSHT